jgi:hypothetical protein
MFDWKILDIDAINQEAIRDGKNLITSRLEEQLAALQDQMDAAQTPEELKTLLP